MKFSQFNTIIPYENKFALYNSFEQKVTFLVPELNDLLKAAILEGISELQGIHPSFYEYLVSEGFVVDSDCNEVDKVKKASKSVDENPESFILTVNPTMNCNFKCWYCYETHVKDSKLDVNIIERINRFVTLTASKPGMEVLSLAFFGGEPLLYFNKTVKPIIDHYDVVCKQAGVLKDISFTTNAYLINQEFIDYFNEKGIKCGLQITLDGDEEEHDKVRFVSKTKGSFKEIIKNVKLLITNEFYVRLRINYTDKNIHNTHNIIKEFDDIPQNIKKDFLMVDFQRVWQNQQVDNTSEVLDEKMDAFTEQGMRVKGTYSPNNVLDSCYADKRNSAVINYNGDIFKCTARDFTTEDRAGFINEMGELIWENDYLERRMSAKFKNKPCLSCKIMPLCNGGCSQHAMEKTEDYCIYFGDESEKDKVVKAKIDEMFTEPVV